MISAKAFVQQELEREREELRKLGKEVDTLNYQLKRANEVYAIKVKLVIELQDALAKLES